MDISPEILNRETELHANEPASDSLLSFSDNQWNPEILISTIQSHLKGRLSQFASVSSQEEYTQVAQFFPDEITDLLKELSSCHFENHRYLWLLTVGEVVRAAFVVSSYAEIVPEPSTQMSFATTSMMPTMNEICLYLENLVKEWEFDSLRKSLDSTSDRLTLYFYRTLTVACDWLTKGPRLLHDEACLHVIVHRISTIDQNSSEELMATIFPTLASFSRSAFFCGCPDLVLQIDERLSSVSHATALLLLYKLEFKTLMDFCRYFGYCLVTCAVSGDKIDQNLCNRADIFLTALIGLPNLRVLNYTIRKDLDPEGPHARTPNRYITVEGREELSFFYIINSILRMNHLVELVNTTERFQSECRFLSVSLHSRVSKALDVLASAPHSHTPSVVALPAFEIDARNALPARNSWAMSSILEDGTYKEKLILVLSFLQHLKLVKENTKGVTRKGKIIKLVQTFTVHGLLPNVDLRLKLANDDILSLINRIDKFRYPGKMVFVEALRKIVSLCELLFVKHIYETMNIKSGVDALLEHIFQTLIPFSEVMNVKSLMELNSAGELGYFHKPILLEDEQLKEYSKCLERFTLLELQF